MVYTAQSLRKFAMARENNDHPHLVSRRSAANGHLLQLWTAPFPVVFRLAPLDLARDGGYAILLKSQPWKRGQTMHR